MLKNKIKIFAVSLLCISYTACTEVDICKDTIHPHIAQIETSYNWPSDIQVEDSMVLIPYRIVNDWRCGYILDSETGEGRPVFNIDAESFDIDTVKNNPDLFFSKCGDMCFITYSHKPSDNGLWCYGLNAIEQAGISELNAMYKHYSLSDFLSHEPLAEGWDEFNGDTDYVLSNAATIYYQTLKEYNVESGRINTISFTPKSIMQDIEFRFNIETENVDIERVVAGVSGVSGKFNFFKGMPLVGQTYNTLFAVENDGASNYKGEISVLGLVRNNKAFALTGDGILQLSVHMKTGEKYNLQMNLYNTISEYSREVIAAREKVILDIAAPIVIDANGVTTPNTGQSDVDKWVVK